MCGDRKGIVFRKFVCTWLNLIDINIIRDANSVSKSSGFFIQKFTIRAIKFLILIVFTKYLLLKNYSNFIGGNLEYLSDSFINDISMRRAARIVLRSVKIT